MKTKALLLCLVVTICAGSGVVMSADNADTLVGTFAIEENGQLNEFIRVEHTGGDYLMSLKQSGRWLTPVKVTPVDKAKLEGMLKESVSTSFVGLGSGQIMIFKMPSGWHSGKFETKSGYWVATVLGPIELHQR